MSKKSCVDLPEAFLGRMKTLPRCSSKNVRPSGNCSIQSGRLNFRFGYAFTSLSFGISAATVQTIASANSADTNRVTVVKDFIAAILADASGLSIPRHAPERSDQLARAGHQHWQPNRPRPNQQQRPADQNQSSGHQRKQHRVLHHANKVTDRWDKRCPKVQFY